jgi:hypothetical protein
MPRCTWLIGLLAGQPPSLCQAPDGARQSGRPILLVAELAVVSIYLFDGHDLEDRVSLGLT